MNLSRQCRSDRGGVWPKYGPGLRAAARGGHQTITWPEGIRADEGDTVRFGMPVGRANQALRVARTAWLDEVDLMAA